MEVKQLPHRLHGIACTCRTVSSCCEQPMRRVFEPDDRLIGVSAHVCQHPTASIVRLAWCRCSSECIANDFHNGWLERFHRPRSASTMVRIIFAPYLPKCCNAVCPRAQQDKTESIHLFVMTALNRPSHSPSCTYANVRGYLLIVRIHFKQLEDRLESRGRRGRMSVEQHTTVRQRCMLRRECNNARKCIWSE